MHSVGYVTLGMASRKVQAAASVGVPGAGLGSPILDMAKGRLRSRVIEVADMGTSHAPHFNAYA